MSKIQPQIRDAIQAKLWAECDERGWIWLPYAERAPFYERWTKDPAIGGQLAHMMDPRAVRVYIKDTLVKPYVRERLLGSEELVLGALQINLEISAVRRYIKPHGVKLEDGRVLCWGRSREWKSILLAIFERGTASDASPFGGVLVESGQTEAPAKRALVRDAATRLGIVCLEWLDGE